MDTTRALDRACVTVAMKIIFGHTLKLETFGGVSLALMALIVLGDSINLSPCQAIGLTDMQLRYSNTRTLFFDK